MKQEETHVLQKLFKRIRIALVLKAVPLLASFRLAQIQVLNEMLKRLVHQIVGVMTDQIARHRETIAAKQTDRAVSSANKSY